MAQRDVSTCGSFYALVNVPSWIDKILQLIQTGLVSNVARNIQIARIAINRPTNSNFIEIFASIYVFVIMNPFLYPILERIDREYSCSVIKPI